MVLLPGSGISSSIHASYQPRHRRVHVGRKDIVVVSVYIPNLSSTQINEEALEALDSRISRIKQVVQQGQLHDLHTKAVVTSDFN